MLFTLSKLVGPLLTPLNLFVAGALALAFFCPRRTRWALLALLFALWLASAPWFTNTLVRGWEAAYPPVALDDLPQADAIVVLSGMLVSHPAHGRADRLEFQGSVDRVLEGARLLDAGKAPYLLLAGGAPSARGEDEPPRLAEWLRARGVDPTRLVLETESRTTSENAAASARIARERGWRRLILVTSALHMRRAARSFERAGVEVIPYSADFLAEDKPLAPLVLLPSEEALLTTRRLGREVLGLAAYRLAGRVE